MADDDFDWGDIAVPGQVVAVASPDPPLAIVAVPVAHDRLCIAEAPTPKPKPKPRAKSTSTLALPAPQHQDTNEKFLAAARMRERKSMQTRLRDSDAKDQMEGCLQELRQAGLLRDGGKTRVKVSAATGSSCTSLSIELPEGGIREKIPFSMMPLVAYTKINRTADASRAFGLDPRTINRIVALAAACCEKETKDFCRRVITLLSAEIRGYSRWVVVQMQRSRRLTCQFWD